jgi:hypothetical protein
MPGEQQQTVTRRIPLAAPMGRQRVSVKGHALSVVLHGLLVTALVWGAQRGAAAMREPGEGPGRGGGGGGGRRAFQVFLPAAPAPPAAPVPEPDQLVVPAHVQPLDSILPQVASADTAPSPAQPGEGPGAGTGAGPGSGPGSGGGTGGGSGGGIGPDSGAGGGGGGRVFPPQPRGILLPPDGRPQNLRGVRLLVRFDISERGEVLRVATEPEIRDRGYRNAFLDRMRRYTFAPATLAGRPVRGTFEITITIS